jgi:erythromycin esterase-like protein
VPERDHWIRLLAGLRDLTASSWATNFSAPLLEDVVNYPVRDRVMGEDLAWLARGPFRGRKIVVWMASAHAARGLAAIETSRADLQRLYRVHHPAGDVAHALLGDEVYTVGVIAHHGSHKFAILRGDPIAVPAPAAGSLEDLFHRGGFQLAVLDLRHPGRRGRWLGAPLVASPLGYEPMRARWSEVFDGLLFVDAMEPSQRVPKPTP